VADKAGKRLLDITAALSGLLLLAPVLLALALLVVLGSGKPVLHREQRLGRGGHLFTLYKFRSLRFGTGELSSVAPDNDSRITIPGRWLRRWRLDELPQLYNVLRGDMSLVGPRPLPPHHARAIPAANLRRLLSVRPGLTSRAALQFLAEDAVLARRAGPEKVYLEHLLPARVEMDLHDLTRATLARDLGTLWTTLATLWSRRARDESYRLVIELVDSARLEEK